MIPMRSESARPQAGFTLIEVMVAMTIMAVAFGTLLAIQGASLRSTTKAQELNVVSMLAQNEMIDTELELQGKAFEEVKTEDGGTFPDPYQDYEWKRVIKEIKFPALNLAPPPSSGDASSAASSSGTDSSTELLAKMTSNFFSKGMREVTVTISWKRGGGDQSYSISTYWVNLNNELQLSQ
jgi:prepilin-type N-terminal cleavage/methylation domain-containing protein